MGPPSEAGGNIFSPIDPLEVWMGYNGAAVRNVDVGVGSLLFLLASMGPPSEDGGNLIALAIAVAVW